MEPPEAAAGRRGAATRLVVNADDFGRSRSINAAVRQAHEEGILTTASLMVGGEAFDEAVAMARDMPGLGVGLHLTLVCGRSVLPPGRIPGLVDAQGTFSSDPASAGWRYWHDRRLRGQIEAEVAAQVERFHATGLPLDHVNGHLHLHLHPVVWEILQRHQVAWSVGAVRCTCDSWWRNRGLLRGRLAYRLSHALIFGVLGGRARRACRAMGVRHTDHVHGLLADGRVDEGFLLGLLPRLGPGTVEIYSHPCGELFPAELAALVSPRVREQVRELGLRLVRYQDL